MDELIFSFEATCEKYAHNCIGRALIKTLVKRMIELACEGKIDEAEFKQLTNDEFARCVNALRKKENAESAYSKAAYRDNPEPVDVLRELRGERDDAEQELQDALTSLCVVALKLLRTQ